MLNTKNRDGFRSGYTQITSELDQIGVEFGILKLKAGEEHTETFAGESVWLLMTGEAVIAHKATARSAEPPAQPANGQSAGNRQSGVGYGMSEVGDRNRTSGVSAVKRESLFDNEPTALHVSIGTTVAIKAMKDCEWAVIRTENNEAFEPRLFLPKDVKPEYRGKGLVQDACMRNVRLVFDKETRGLSKLVIGEVVNYPGKWSSYPPHHHDQPEIYHYRFTMPQGYGHGEVGDDVFKIKNGDTLSIDGGQDHAQVAAPGYGMYYLWIVKHLDQNPYMGFEFTEEHRWVLDPKNQGWEPKI